MPVHRKEKLTKTRSTGTSYVPNLCNKGRYFLACGIRQLYCFFFYKYFILSWWFYWWNIINRFFKMGERAWHFSIISPSAILFSLLDPDLCTWLTFKKSTNYSRGVSYHICPYICKQTWKRWILDWYSACVADDRMGGRRAQMLGDVTASVSHSTSSCLRLTGMRGPKCNFQKVAKITLIQICNEGVSKIYLTH